MKYFNINEETLKNNVAQDYFPEFDCREIIRNIDFTVKKSATPKDGTHPCVPYISGAEANEYFLWAEAKAQATDLLTMLTQLILTIGKSKITEERIPPPFLGCFDCNKITFVEYSEIMEIFSLSDFNWNITPSNPSTREFLLVHDKLEGLVGNKLYIFDFVKEENELQAFIKENFIIGKSAINKIQITKNNFIWVYLKWLKEVKPTIRVADWNLAKENGIFDLDFYLADLLSEDNISIMDKLNILLNHSQYEVKPEKAKIGLFRSYNVDFSDGQKAHTQFWFKYQRPPRAEYWDYIINRRDLLVPQDIRERKGSFFTPQIWVELSQKYIADVFGEDWQENYYVWDCAAGTGNLLAGLTNKYRIYASTIDQADVKIMHERIKSGANLLEDHVFQFDFLNDSFEELPDRLKKIIKDTPEKLIIYINPPYAEAGSTTTRTGTGKNKANVANSSVYDRFTTLVGTATRELYVQFFLRIYKDLPKSKLCSFSKLKIITAANFTKFRDVFKAKYLKGFVVPSDSFDNVKGTFPIGFLIWDLAKKKSIGTIETDAHSQRSLFLDKKKFYVYPQNGLAIDWLRQYYDKKGETIGFLRMAGTDMQNNNTVFITNKLSENDLKKTLYTQITKNNILKICIYNTIRHMIKNTWLNDRDYFLFPTDAWKGDPLFQTDCLIYSIFHNSNQVQSTKGANHWIPFPEHEVSAKTEYESHFLIDFINGEIKPEKNGTFIFEVHDTKKEKKKTSLIFSDRALEVLKAGRALWTYYHTQPNCNVNASFYDIREYFQGRDEKGRMKASSDDAMYNKLLGDLKLEMKFLALQIEPKVYEYGFLL